ncbi:unnamed protein product (mitochondrion) [Plasmodiophora brassicae]|uniref:C2H2-type domain-containing protein n=1 Tax=Plasmodiophora brassicae TaxID=37360 RepID=A0A3P3YHZ2_PLABS|nr:unnamed protein product [Plasmodiophora brassicae]
MRHRDVDICPRCFRYFDDRVHIVVRASCCAALFCRQCRDKLEALPACPFCGKARHACPYPDCGMSFSKPCALVRHSRKHTGEKPFQCAYPGCRRAFAEKGNMLRHVHDVHRGEKPFQCAYEHCLQRFARKSHLVAHAASQHNDDLLRP